MPDLLQKLDKLKKAFAKGQVIIKEGEVGGDFYILLKGEAEVKIGDKHLADIHANDGEIFFGEMSSILHEPRSATIIAKENCLVLAVPPDALVKVLQLSPSLLTKLLRQLAHRIKELNKVEAGLDKDVAGLKDNLEKKLIEVMGYTKSLLGLLEIMAAKESGNPVFNSLKNYLVESNPFNLKAGNASSLKPDLLEKHNLKQYLG